MNPLRGGAIFSECLPIVQRLSRFRQPCFSMKVQVNCNAMFSAREQLHTKCRLCKHEKQHLGREWPHRHECDEGPFNQTRFQSWMAVGGLRLNRSMLSGRWLRNLVVGDNFHEREAGSLDSIDEACCILCLVLISVLATTISTM